MSELDFYDDLVKKIENMPVIITGSYALHALGYQIRKEIGDIDLVSPSAEEAASLCVFLANSYRELSIFSNNINAEYAENVISLKGPFDGSIKDVKIDIFVNKTTHSSLRNPIVCTFDTLSNIVAAKIRICDYRAYSARRTENVNPKDKEVFTKHRNDISNILSQMERKTWPKTLYPWP